jgi:hypothetical protein
MGVAEIALIYWMYCEYEKEEMLTDLTKGKNVETEGQEKDYDCRLYNLFPDATPNKRHFLYKTSDPNKIIIIRTNKA